MTAPIRPTAPDPTVARAAVVNGNVLTLTPPLTTTGRDMDRALDILDEAIGEEER